MGNTIEFIFRIKIKIKVFILIEVKLVFFNFFLGSEVAVCKIVIGSGLFNRMWV